MAGGGLSELICCSGKKSVEVLDTDDCLSIRVAAACFMCSAAADKCLLPECLIEALFRQSKAGGAILRAVQAGSFFFFFPLVSFRLCTCLLCCSLSEKLYLQDSASPAPAL